MNLTFEEAVNKLETAPAETRLVVPVRITAHGEDGAVLFGFGGLGLPPSERGFVYVSSGDLMLTQPNSYDFVGARLMTEDSFTNLTNQRVRLLNNLASDVNRSDNLIPPNFQSFLIDQAQRASVQIGLASREEHLANPRLILRLTRGSGPDFVGVDVELEQQDVFLTGQGALSSGTNAVWTISFLDPIPWAINEL